MFRPLQGHLQGARKLHSLHIQCFCLLSHLVQFLCHIYITVYLLCLYLKYIKNTEYGVMVIALFLPTHALQLCRIFYTPTYVSTIY
jgi:hypothetical protein